MSQLLNGRDGVSSSREVSIDLSVVRQRVYDYPGKTLDTEAAKNGYEVLKYQDASELGRVALKSRNIVLSNHTLAYESGPLFPDIPFAD